MAEEVDRGEVVEKVEGGELVEEDEGSKDMVQMNQE